MVKVVVTGIVDYFAARAWLPLLAYAGYLLARGRVPRRLEPWLTHLGAAAYIGVAALLSVAMFTNFPLSDFVGANLGYKSAIEGMVFGALVVLMVRGDAALGFTASALCISAAGWLYEVPFWHPIQMFVTPFGDASPLLVNTQIISLGLLGYTLWRRGWRPGRRFAAVFLVYVIQFIYLAEVYPAYYPFIIDARDWIIRLPSYALLAAAIHESPKLS